MEDRFFVKVLENKLCGDLAVQNSHLSREKTIEFELGLFLEDEDKLLSDINPSARKTNINHRDTDQADNHNTNTKEESIFVRINEAMEIMHEEKILTEVLSMISKPIKEKDGHACFSDQLSKDDLLNLKEKYRQKKKQLFEIKQKNNCTG